MFQRFLIRYGLAVHLALLAAGPCALMPFLSAGQLVTVLFWMSALTVVWLLAAPSILAGEHYCSARLRVRQEILRDPLFWLLLLVLLVALVRCLNNGVAMFYDAEKVEWRILEASFPMLPASAGQSALLPLAITVALGILLMGVRHGLGLSARIMFGLLGALFSGFGWGAAALMACLGHEAFVAEAMSPLSTGQGWGIVSGAWLFIALGSGVQAEVRKWGAARLLFCLAVAGNAAGLVIFDPPVVAGAWLVALVLYFMFALSCAGRSGSKSAVARLLVLAVLGFSFPAFLLMAVAPGELLAVKDAGLDFLALIPENLMRAGEALDGIARRMWLQSPWCGTGIGTFGMNVQFLAERADWSVLPPAPQCAFNAYWTFLAERGIVGCALLLGVMGLLIVVWAIRLGQAFSFLRTKDDADKFAFAVPPVAWVGPIVMVLAGIELVWTPLNVNVGAPLAVALAVALAATSFPRRKREMLAAQKDPECASVESSESK